MRIVGGIEAEPHSWPFQVLVLRINQKTFKYGNRSKILFEEYYTCGGSLLNKHTVITAAHCVYDHKPNDFVRQNRISYRSIFKVFVGFHEIKLVYKNFNIKDSSTLGIEVTKVIIVRTLF